jgi:hypothetical protein
MAVKAAVEMIFVVQEPISSAASGPGNDGSDFV